MDSKPGVEKEIQSATRLSLVEMGLGSVLHALHVPLAGHFLSLNQGFFLLRDLRRGGERNAVVTTSLIVSVFKSLSPVGKRLGPMLSIAMQGFLLWLGLLIAGTALPGQMLGMVLLSTWGFLQPVVTMVLVFGTDLPTAAGTFWAQLRGELPWVAHLLALVFFALVGLKALLAASLPVALRKVSESQLVEYEARLETLGQKRLSHFSQSTSAGPLRGLGKDLSNPYFLASLALTAGFWFYFDQSRSDWVWKALRPLAVYLLLIWVSRSARVAKALTAFLSYSELGRKILAAAAPLKLKRD